MSRAPAKREANYHHGDLARALVTAAEAILAEDGEAGFTLRECARRAGVSHAAPAHHFGDTRGLLTEVAAVGFERLAAKMRAAREAVPADEQLDAIGMAYIEFALAHPAVFRLMFHNDRIDTASEHFHGASQSAFALLQNTVEGAPARTARRDTLDAASLRAWSLVHGFAMLALDGQLGPLDKRNRAALPKLAARVLQADLSQALAGKPKPTRKIGAKK